MGWTRGTLDAVVGLEVKVCIVWACDDAIDQGTGLGVAVVVLGTFCLDGKESRAVALRDNNCGQFEIRHLHFHSLSY
jgi:hypothetical protein